VLSVAARTRTGPATSVVLLILAVLWLFLAPSDLSLVAAAIGYAAAAIGVDVATGYAGQPNFGQAAFMAIGCYAGAVFQQKVGGGFLIGLLFAVVLCAAIASVLGLAAVRLEHLGFGIVTFTFAFATAAFLSGQTLESLTNGPNGLALPESNLLGSQLTEPSTLYIIGLVILALCAWVAHHYVRSRSGRAMLTVKQDERVASVLGIEPMSVKLRAFAVSAAFGGAGGVIVGQGVGFVTPQSFPPTVSIMVFGMAAFGGVGTITGPILGAMFFWLVPSYVPGLEHYQGVFVGAVFLAGLVFLPAGIFGSGYDLVIGSRRWPPWRRTYTEAPEVAAIAPAADRPQPTGASVVAVAVADRPATGTAAVAPSGSAEPLLRARGVRVVFGGVTAVADASLEVAAGTCHGLVGPNGAGKTTLLNALSGIVPTAAGEIELDGSRIDGAAPQKRRARGLGRTFQNPSLVGDLTALDNVKVGLYPVQSWSAARDLIGLGLSRAGERRTTEAAVEALDAVGFPAERRDVIAASLSHGEQKIVDLARAMAGRPRMLLLDEPTAGLTVSEMEAFAVILGEQVRGLGTTMLIVSHHMRFLSGLAQSVTVMESGSVLADGEFEVVSNRPEVINAFLGEYDAAI
jgi:branched-chain amino acid transport system permease protein